MTRKDLLHTVRDLYIRHDTTAFAILANEVHPSDLADVVETLAASTDATSMLASLKTTILAELFAYFSKNFQNELLRKLPDETIVALFKDMAADERVDLFQNLDDIARRHLLPSMPDAEREDILRLAAFPKGSIGSVTTSAFVAVQPDTSVAQALAHIRATATDKETIYVIYVLDREGHLCGALSLRELLLADDAQDMSAIMRPDPVVAQADWPMGKASELIRHYDLLALPVINGGEKMIGIVTVDDAMDIEKQEDTARLTRFGGATATEEQIWTYWNHPYAKCSAYGYSG